LDLNVKTVDVLGWRGKLAIIVPSTNTIVQPELDAMRPQGVTNHIARVAVPDVPLTDDAAFSAFMDLIDDALHDAVKSALSCNPQALIMGMSSETFWGGSEGSRKLKKRLESWSRCPVITGSEAANAALRCYGALRIGIVTPYMPVGDMEVMRYFTDMGYTVASIRGLCCSSPTAIAHTQSGILWDALAEVNRADVDAILQCGTNLSMATLAPQAEALYKKPVLAINTVLYWHSLRSLGLPDHVHGFGNLLAEH
jgi:maleate isomerase